jgi:thiol-disulfide isomerase/thioredoxin
MEKSLQLTYEVQVWNKNWKKFCKFVSMKFNKLFKTFLFCAFLASSQAQINVKISGNIFNFASDSLRVSQVMNNQYIDYLKGTVDKKGNFEIKGKVPNPDYYVFRVGQSLVHLVLKKDSDIKIYGDAKSFGQFSNIVGSEESVKLNEVVGQLQLYNYKKDSATMYLREHPDQEAVVNQSFGVIHYNFLNYKNNFLKENPNSPAIIPLISSVDPESEFPLYENIVTQLMNGFPESPSVQQVNAQYLQQKAKKDEMSFLDPGKLAPNFTQPMVDGKMLSLSDLKGKVVLIDFWASWCGPCRKENPNVVKLYEQYKDKGFTVLSVSLDKDKNAWIAAIQKDHLSWPNHVSDLKSWSNEASRLYKVTGIPFTVLVDQDGKIIDKNLRGADLENKLKSIFGN